jgi:NAD(P)H dehydrogenase (quinone)
VILITGATGSIGNQLVQCLREQRVPFRALVRDEDKGRALGCGFAVADFDDPSSVAAAMAGVDRLFLNAGGAVPADGEQPMVRQQKAVIDAARDAGVSQIVKVSVWGARQGGPLAQGAHWEIEQYLKRSAVGWSVLQPGGFMQNFLTGAGSLTSDGKLIDPYDGAAVSYIDCYDIAACAAALLTGPGRSGETFILTGPQALSHAVIAAKLSAALGQTFRAAAMSPEQLADTLKTRGLPEPFTNDIAALSRQVAAGSMATTTPDARNLTGRAPRTFDEFAVVNREALRAAFRVLATPARRLR